jgi:DNA-binding transcriptional LysR family regulator
MPTDVGQLLLDLARPIVNESIEAERQLRHVVTAQTGQIRVGAAPYPADISVGRAAGLLSRQRPGARIDISVGDWPAMTRSLLNGDVDIAVAEISEIEADQRLHIEPLSRQRGVVFVRKGHPLTRRRGVVLDDIAGFPLVGTELPQRLAELVRRHISSHREQPRAKRTIPDIRVDTFCLVRQIVEFGDAVGVGLASQIRRDVHAGRITILPLKLAWLTTDYGIIRLAGRTPCPLLVEFMHILRKVEGELQDD